MQDNYTAQVKKVVIASGKLATIEDALARPDDFELSLSFLGYGVREIGSDFTTLLSIADGIRLYMVMVDKLIRDREKRITELEKECSQ